MNNACGDLGKSDLCQKLKLICIHGSFPVRSYDSSRTERSRWFPWRKRKTLFLATNVSEAQPVTTDVCISTTNDSQFFRHSTLYVTIRVLSVYRSFCWFKRPVAFSFLTTYSDRWRDIHKCIACASHNGRRSKKVSSSLLFHLRTSELYPWCNWMTCISLHPFSSWLGME